MASNLSNPQREEREVEKRTRLRKPKKYRKHLERGAKRPDLMIKRVTEVDLDANKSDKNDLDLSLRSRYALIARMLISAVPPKTPQPNVITGKNLPGMISMVGGFDNLYNTVNSYATQRTGVYLKNILSAIRSQGLAASELLDNKCKSAGSVFRLQNGYYCNFAGFLQLADLYKTDKLDYSVMRTSLDDYYHSLNVHFSALDKLVKKETNSFKFVVENASKIDPSQIVKFLGTYGPDKIKKTLSSIAIINNDRVLKAIYEVGFLSLLAQELSSRSLGVFINIPPELGEAYDLIKRDKFDDAFNVFIEYLNEQHSGIPIESMLNEMIGVFYHQVLENEFLEGYIKTQDDPLGGQPTEAMKVMGKIHDFLKDYRLKILEKVKEKILKNNIDDMFEGIEFDTSDDNNEDWHDPRKMLPNLTDPNRLPDFVLKNPELKQKFEGRKNDLDDKLKKKSISKEEYNLEALKINRDSLESFLEMHGMKKSSSYALNERVGTGMNTRISAYHGVDQRDFHPESNVVVWERRFYNPSDEKTILDGAKDFMGQDWCKFGWDGGANDASCRSALDLSIALSDGSKYAGKIESRLYDFLLNKLMGGEVEPFTDTLFVDEITGTKRKQATMENRVASAEVPISTLIRVAFENPGARSVLLPIITAASKSKKAAPKDKKAVEKEEQKTSPKAKKAAPKEMAPDSEKASPKAKKAAPKEEVKAKKASPKAKKRKASSSLITMEDTLWV